MNQNTVVDLLERRDFATMRRSIIGMRPVEVAQLLESLPPEDELVAFRLLPKGMAVEVFEQMEADQQRRLLESFTTEGAREIIEEMSPDDRAALMDEVPAMVARRLLQLLSPGERKVTMTLLGYEEGTAGRVMTPDFVDLRRDMTIAEALMRIRRQSLDRETVYESYVIDDERHLLGTVSLKDLVLTSPDVKVENIMHPNPKAVYTHTDQEEAAQVLRDYDLLAVPVIDHEERLVGIITWDDVVDIMEREATEDIYRYATVPVATERWYFTTNIFNVVRRRILWLSLLILVNTITGSVISGQSELLEEVVILAAFVPLLIGTGGNVGAQSSTVVIRGLATGEIPMGRAIAIMVREVGVGSLLGVSLGVLVFGWAFLLGRDLQVATVVSLTMASIAAMAALMGAALPFLFRQFRLDPAMVSAPFITTIMDIFGVALYFLVANLLLRL
jgi:magnesium transporter